MKGDSRTRRKITFYTCLVFVFIGILHYFVFTPTITELRTIMSVSSETYDARIDSISDRGGEVGSTEYFFSPNFESKADTLKGQGMRRFEMREYYLDVSKQSKIREDYYQKAGMEVPEIIFNEKFGERKPVGVSIGLMMSGIALTLLVSYSFLFFQSRKEQDKK